MPAHWLGIPWGRPPGLRGSPRTRPSPIALCAVALFATSLFADGGAVLSRQESGPFVITVFAMPVPLRAGPIDLTVLVQTRDSLEPILDANVSIRLAGDSQLGAAATRSQAQNKLLYAAALQLPQPGEWKYTVAVRTASGQAAISGAFQAGPPAPPLASYWFYVAIPLVAIAIFVLHQWLSRRSVPRRIAS
jgi:hypothetical protein